MLGGVTDLTGSDPGYGYSGTMGRCILGRRRLLRSSLTLAGLGVISGCGIPPPGGRPARVPARIAVLTPAAIGALPHGRAFLDRLRQDGWIPGENLTVDYRFGKPPDTVMAAVADVVRL